MDFLKRFKKEIFLFLSISALYFLIRLPLLSNLPMFTDEAIYLRWAQIALHDSSWRFISLTDGKQPLFVWVVMVFMKFIQDPLVAGRIVSVISGFFTLWGLWLLSYELFKNKRVSLFTLLIYIFYPFAFVYDRMALMDGMVGTFTVWSLYFSVLLIRRSRLDIAYTLGIITGLGTLTKSTNFFSIYLLPFTLVLFNFREKPLLKRLGKWVLLAGFSAGISYGMYNVLRLSPLYEMISAKNATFIYPVSEWIHHPFAMFLGNLNGLITWWFQYSTVSYLILLAVSLIFLNKFFKEKLILLLYFVLPFIALALFGKVLFPRYIFFMSLSLLPLMAWALDFMVLNIEKYLSFRRSNIILPLVLLVVFLSLPGFVSYKFMMDPANAPVADSDRGQYSNGSAAGWGVKESVSFFRQQAEKGKIYVATEGTFGLMPEAMEMYFFQNKNVTVKGFWPINSFPKEVEDASKKMPTYFIFYQPQHRVIPSDFPLKLLFQVKQGNTNFYYRVYQVLPK